VVAEKLVGEGSLEGEEVVVEKITGGWSPE
jgi:hypothetical protein